VLLAVQDTRQLPFDADRLRNLPEPVSRWLRTSGALEQKPVRRVRLRQRGRMRLKPGQKQWIGVEARAIYTLDNPGFLWQIRTAVSGLPLVGRDLYFKGKGAMEIRIGGVIPVVRVSNHWRINEATLQRYLGEMVWVPSGLASPCIEWEAIDAFSARATMTYEGVKGSGVFHFNSRGEVTRFVARRFRDIRDDERREWVVTVIKTGIVDGVRIPLGLEVSWIFEEGPFSWYEFEVFDLAHEYWGGAL